MSGGLERRASRRWRSSPRAYLRKKQLRRAINFLPSLNGATDEGAPRRSRPSRLGRARAARGGETPRVRLRARGRFESRAEPRSHEDAYRLALRTDTVDYSPPARNGTNVTFGLRSAKPRTTRARPRESRVVAGRAAAPCPDHAVAGIARSCLSVARARPARLKTARAEVGVYSSQPIQRETRLERAVLVRFRASFVPRPKFQKKSVRPVSNVRVYLFPGVTNPRARPIDQRRFMLRYLVPKSKPESALVLK